MDTILQAIQNYSGSFVSTIEARKTTSPSPINRENHSKLIVAIKNENWDEVQSIITLPRYQSAFRGVIFCLSRYSSIDDELWLDIADLYEKQKLI